MNLARWLKSCNIPFYFIRFIAAFDGLFICACVLVSKALFPFGRYGPLTSGASIVWQDLPAAYHNVYAFIDISFYSLIHIVVDYSLCFSLNLVDPLCFALLGRGLNTLF